VIVSDQYPGLCQFNSRRSAMIHLISENIKNQMTALSGNLDLL
jgi:hypothetical protein